MATCPPALALLSQDSAITLTRMYVSTYALKNLDVRQVQGNNLKSSKYTRAIKVHHKAKKEKPF